MQACVRWGAHCHHLANTIERPCAAAKRPYADYFDRLLVLVLRMLTLARYCSEVKWVMSVL